MTKLSIALPETPKSLYSEIGVMLLDVLSDAPYTVVLVHDGDEVALDAEVLLIIGDCQAYPEYARLLTAKRDKRPVTILWMLDTLPPVSFTPKAADIGSRLATYNKSLLFLRTHMKPLVSAIPLAARRKMGVAACSALLTGLDDELESTSQGELKGLDTTSRYEILGRYEWMKTNYEHGWLDHVVGNTRSKTDFLQKMEIPNSFIPFGYHPNMGEDIKVERDIDVLFLGELAYGRRKPIVENVMNGLSANGIELTIESGNCYGQKRNELLSRAKISLNVPRFNWDIPTIRLFMSIGCGSLVVSEHAGDSTPFVSGKHFVQSTADELPDVIAYYVKHDDEREAITQNAHELITTEFTLRNAVHNILSLYETP